MNVSVFFLSEKSLKNVTLEDLFCVDLVIISTTEAPITEPFTDEMPELSFFIVIHVRNSNATNIHNQISWHAYSV